MDISDSRAGGKGNYKKWLFVKEKKGVKIKRPADRLPAAVISKLE
jgi:hypothetical protein